MIDKELTFLSSYCIMLDGHHKSVDDFYNSSIQRFDNIIK